jgi:hypothetical protein
VYRKVNNAAPVYVNRIETRMRVNSHHFVLYTLLPQTPAFVMPQPDVIRDLRNADNTLNVSTALTMGYHVFLGGSMMPNYTYTFPAGVALELPANAAVDLNSHYVNTGTASITGEAYANFHTVDRSSVVHVARTLNLSNTTITLPPGQRKTINKTFTFDERRTIVMLTSHMHKLGEKFVIRIAGGARNGEIVYEATDWSHPLTQSFEPPLVLEPGQGLISEVTYNNTTTRTVNFGLTSEDEMGIIFGYYY